MFAKSNPMIFSLPSRWPALIAELIFLLMTVAVFLPKLHHHSENCKVAGRNLVSEEHDCVFCKLTAAFRSIESSIIQTVRHQDLLAAGSASVPPSGSFSLFHQLLSPARAPPVF